MSTQIQFHGCDTFYDTQKNLGYIILKKLNVILDKYLRSHFAYNTIFATYPNNENM
jgi:hypothetical protein